MLVVVSYIKNKIGAQSDFSRFSDRYQPFLPFGSHFSVTFSRCLYALSRFRKLIDRHHSYRLAAKESPGEVHTQKLPKSQ